VSDSERVYSVTCSQGHLTCVTLRKDQVRQHLEQGVMTFYCMVCDDFRRPTPEEMEQLKLWVEGPESSSV
jgi:hypothetical protein